MPRGSDLNATGRGPGGHNSEAFRSACCFTAEYAAESLCFLNTVEVLQLPIPSGGSTELGALPQRPVLEGERPPTEPTSSHTSGIVINEPQCTETRSICERGMSFSRSGLGHAKEIACLGYLVDSALSIARTDLCGWK